MGEDHGRRVRGAARDLNCDRCAPVPHTSAKPASVEVLLNRVRADAWDHSQPAWLDAQRVRVASGKLKADTVDGYEHRLAVYALPEFGGKAIGSITPTQCEQFLAALVARGMTPATLKHHWSTFRAVFGYALRHKAITSNPVDGVDFSGNGAKRRNTRHHPLTEAQVAAVAASIGERYPVYELLTLFAAYTGLRAEELAGCEVGDVQFLPKPVVNVARAKKRKGGLWVSDDLKSAKSRRSVDLPPWLAARLAAYLADTHPRADEPTAPLWPNRALGGARRRGCRAVATLDFSEPVDTGAFYKNLLRPALEAVGLPASRPAYTRDDGTPVAKLEGVRLHDLRHTFATLQLSAGWLCLNRRRRVAEVLGDLRDDRRAPVPNPRAKELSWSGYGPRPGIWRRPW